MFVVVPIKLIVDVRYAQVVCCVVVEAQRTKLNTLLYIASHSRAILAASVK